MPSLSLPLTFPHTTEPDDLVRLVGAEPKTQEIQKEINDLQALLRGDFRDLLKGLVAFEDPAPFHALQKPVVLSQDKQSGEFSWRLQGKDIILSEEWAVIYHLEVLLGLQRRIHALTEKLTEIGLQRELATGRLKKQEAHEQGSEPLEPTDRRKAKNKKDADFLEQTQELPNPEQCKKLLKLTDDEKKEVLKYLARLKKNNGAYDPAMEDLSTTLGRIEKRIKKALSGASISRWEDQLNITTGLSGNLSMETLQDLLLMRIKATIEKAPDQEGPRLPQTRQKALSAEFATMINRLGVAAILTMLVGGVWVGVEKMGKSEKLVVPPTTPSPSPSLSPEKAPFKTFVWAAFQSTDGRVVLFNENFWKDTGGKERIPKTFPDLSRELTECTVRSYLPDRDSPEVFEILHPRHGRYLIIQTPLNALRPSIEGLTFPYTVMMVGQNKEQQIVAYVGHHRFINPDNSYWVMADGSGMEKVPNPIDSSGGIITMAEIGEFILAKLNKR